MSEPQPGLFAREPIFIGHLVAAVLGYFALLAVTRGWITSTQASSLTQQVAPMVTAGLLAGQGALLRRFVSPVQRQKAAKAAAELDTVVLHLEKPANPTA